jgi:hypothetical protein
MRREQVVKVMFWLLYTKEKICPVPAVWNDMWRREKSLVPVGN